MPALFLSYRRADTGDHAQRLSYTIRTINPSLSVFLDVQGIEPGDDWAERIGRALHETKCVLVLIGRRWLDSAEGGPRRRIDDPDDVLRREIRMAIDADITVLPVLVDGARMPGLDELPEDIRELGRPQAFRLQKDVAALLERVGALTGLVLLEERSDEKQRAILELKGNLEKIAPQRTATQALSRTVKPAALERWWASATKTFDRLLTSSQLDHLRWGIETQARDILAGADAVELSIEEILTCLQGMLDVVSPRRAGGGRIRSRRPRHL